MSAKLCARVATRPSPAALATLLLTGCSPSSAPALSLFGAYFPNWLLFGLLAILFASLSRLLFGIVGRAELVPFPLFTHLAIGILLAGLFQIQWLGR